MKSTLLASAFAWLTCFLLATSCAHAQGVGASGDIVGTVTDPSGAVVPKVAVVAVETARGTQYAAITGSTGQYRLTGLLPATYDVTAQVAGFQTLIQKGVVVNVGETSILDFSLKVATSGQTVEVSATPPVVDTERGSQANTLTEQYITDLPIDRRDYLTFTLLLPGVSNSTRLADDQDFRVKQTPQSGLSFYGSNGRGNSVTVDGGEALGDSGGVRTTVSQDAVQEFQVNRSNYAADLGGASGASINIVTKSGTNDLHGSLFSYFRDSALDARDPFAFSQALQPGEPFNPAEPDSVGVPIKNSLSRQQFGGTVGFPIQKDKTFLFVAFEGLLQDAQNAVPILTDTNIFRPTLAQQEVLTAPQIEALTIKSSAFGGTPLDDYIINSLESNGGVFPYNTHEYLASARLDHRISNSDQISFSFRFGHDLEENPDVQSLTGFSSGSSIHTYDDTIQGAWFHEFSPSAQNELHLQYDYNSFNVIPNEPGEVGLQIPGFANNLGTNIFLPNFTILRRTEIADNMTLVRGSHTIKFGGSELLRGNHSESHTFFPGRIVFGTLPGALVGLPTIGLNSLQSASFGLPQFYQQGFGNADYPAYTRPLTGLYLQDSWRITPSFTLNYGIRYEIDSQYNPLSTYYGDVAPRISFAWDPFKDHKTVIRGGYGIFYGPIDSQIPQVDLSLGVLNKNRSTVENQKNPQQIPNQVLNAQNTCGIGFPGIPVFPGTGASPCTRFISIYADPLPGLPPLAPGLPAIAGAATIFQTLFAENLIQCTTPTPGNSACITPADLAPFNLFVSNSGQLSPLQVLFSNPQKYRPPYSQQASIGIEREISPGFSISLSGIYSHTLRLPVAIDTNLLKAPFVSLPLANGGTATYRDWNTNPEIDVYSLITGNPSPCAANPFACFVNPVIVQNNQYTAAASALYEGGILEIKKRFSNNFAVFGNYTYSKAFDTSTDFNTDYGPQDPTNLNADRGLSEFDQRNKVVIAGVFDSPWKQAILSGFQLSPIFTYTSGHPFNLLVEGEDNGDNHVTNERPIGAPRDTGLGPNLIDFDMRLTWQHKLTERVNLIITAEGFNIANRTNFASVNNEVDPLFALPTALGGDGNTTFNVHGIRPGAPLPGGGVATSSTPLGFTSDLPKREFQLGARLTF